MDNLSEVRVIGETIEVGGFAVADLRPVLRGKGPVVPATVRERLVDYINGIQDDIEERDQEITGYEERIEDANQAASEAEEARDKFETAMGRIRDNAAMALEGIEALCAAGRTADAGRMVAALKEWLRGAFTSAQADEPITPFAEGEVA